VENSFKYAFHNNPPWEINISGHQAEGKWQIIVCDNGIGMSVQEIDEIRQMLNEARKTKDIRSLQIGGMGLMNVYIRLSLLYGDNAGIHINNQTDGGICVTLFGPISTSI